MARIPEARGRRIAGWSPARVAAATAPKGLAGPAVFFAVTVAALYVARDILIPIVIAMLLSFVLGALVNLLRRIGLPRIVAIVLSVLTAIGIVALLSAVIGMQLADLAGQAPRYSSVVEQKVESLKEGTVGRASDYLRVIGREIHRAGTAEPEPAAPQAGAGAKPQGREEQKPVVVEVREPEQSPLQLARAILAPTLAPLTTAGIVFVVLIFILIQREDLRDRLIRLVGSNDLHRTTGAMDDAAKRLSRYFVVQLLLNAAFGIVVGVGLWIIGVPNPVLWGIFSALMRFVPYIGAFISAILPLALATAVDPGWSMVIFTLALFLVTETLTGQMIEPMVYGHSTGLSPFAVLVSALFWTWLWGPVGLLLSTPLTVCLVVLGRHVEQLEFLDVLFGDQPALTPVENFYQRILADDPEEAQEQAEAMLKDTSLIAYYDSVVVKALRLASIDAQRGVLTDDQLARVQASVHDLVAELADHDDAPPGAGQAFTSRLFARRPGAAEAEPLPVAPARARAGLPAEWQGEGAVLCVAGRGPLDEAAATLLAQLLGRHGFGVRILSRPETSRARLEAIDPHRTRMACIVHLDMLGSSSHLRFLVQRLRRRMPECAILVGLWPEEAEASLRRDTGADIDVVSLQEAVEACAARALQHDAPVRLSATTPAPQREDAEAEPAPV